MSSEIMISRVAESCFWLQRYMERADSTARLLKANRDFVLDVNVEERWEPVIVVVGEQERFEELLGEDVEADDAAQDYLAFDERNPVSLISSVRWARENARTIREIVSNEMWECLNSFWLRLRDPATQAAYKADRAQLYQDVIELAATFAGLAYGTMMHEQPFDFLRLGGFLERAAQTARIVDVKHHMLTPEVPAGVESALEAAQWMTLLRSCSGTETFFKRNRGAPSGPKVAGFLILEPRFPRSILHCLQQAAYVMARIREELPEPIGEHSSKELELLLLSVEEKGLEDFFAAGIHEELTRIIDSVADVCALINRDYFDPALESLPPPARSA